MKTFKEILKELTEARYVSSDSYRIGPSGRKIKRRIKVADDSYHQEDDLDKDGDVDKDDRRLAKESTISEATSVKTQKYSWGTMKTIHHGADFSIPLHPEHHEPIAKLGDDQEHKFKDETGKHWTAKRQGADVHFQSGSMKTKVPHSTMQESTSKPVLLNEPEDKDVDTVTKDKDGKVTAWQHIGKWKKATHKDPSGVAPHLSDVALRKTIAMTKSEAFSSDDKVGSTKPSPTGTYKKTDTGLIHTREYGDAKKDAADDKKYWDDADKPEKKTRAKTGSFKRRFNTVAGRIAQGVK